MFKLVIIAVWAPFLELGAIVEQVVEDLLVYAAPRCMRPRWENFAAHWGQFPRAHPAQIYNNPSLTFAASPWVFSMAAVCGIVVYCFMAMAALCGLQWCLGLQKQMQDGQSLTLFWWPIY